jgi:hypothetical protein
MGMMKYKSISCKCKQGHIHMSRGEAGYCNEIRLQQKAKMFYAYGIQKKYELKVNGVFIGNHYVDFTIYKTKADLENDRVTEVREFKGGMLLDVWRMKKNLFNALYPDIPYVVVQNKY